MHCGRVARAAREVHNLDARIFNRDVERLEHARRETLLLAEQPEKDVLGADVVVVKCPRLVLSEHDDLASTFGEAFEHDRTVTST